MNITYVDMCAVSRHAILLLPQEVAAVHQKSMQDVALLSFQNAVTWQKGRFSTCPAWFCLRLFFLFLTLLKGLLLGLLLFLFFGGFLSKFKPAGFT